MAAEPDIIDVLVADIGWAIAFYRTLEPPAPDDVDGQDQAEMYVPGYPKSGSLSERVVRQADPGWVVPVATGDGGQI